MKLGEFREKTKDCNDDYELLITATCEYKAAEPIEPDVEQIEINHERKYIDLIGEE